LIKSDIADMRNIGKDTYAGAIVGAVFLQQFVDKTPWAHLDIAGPAFLQEEKEYNPKGATGAAARLFIDLLQNWQTIE
jgi:leucyl aminopeptidase